MLPPREPAIIISASGVRRDRMYETEVMTKARGMVHAEVWWTRWEGVYEVEFYQFGMNLLSSITVFCGSRHFKRTGDRYTIIRRKPTDYANQTWLELEQIGSNLILLNT